MEYIDLEDGHPTASGFYNVRVMEFDGTRREEKANWTEDSGFELIDSELAPEEYIFEWAPGE